jgi:hypothetical protein
MFRASKERLITYVTIVHTVRVGATSLQVIYVQVSLVYRNLYLYTEFIAVISE